MSLARSCACQQRSTVFGPHGRKPSSQHQRFPKSLQSMISEMQTPNKRKRPGSKTFELWICSSCSCNVMLPTCLHNLPRLTLESRISCPTCPTPHKPPLWANSLVRFPIHHSLASVHVYERQSLIYLTILLEPRAFKC